MDLRISNGLEITVGTCVVDPRRFALATAEERKGIFEDLPKPLPQYKAIHGRVRGSVHVSVRGL